MIETETRRKMMYAFFAGFFLMALIVNATAGNSRQTGLDLCLFLLNAWWALS